MNYNDKVLISKTDTKYCGGDIFKNLMERATLGEVTHSLDRTGYQCFYLDVFCYTHRSLQPHEQRAVILMNTPRPLYESNIKMYVVNSVNKTEEVEYIEVIPEPDNEYSIREKNWLHDMKSFFLTGKGFSIQFYEGLKRYNDVNPYLVKSDLFGKTIETALDRFEYVQQVKEYLSWIAKEARNASSKYGYAQRNRNSYEAIERLSSSWGGNHCSPFNWGDYDDLTKRFVTNDNLNLIGALFNQLSDNLAGYTNLKPDSLLSEESKKIILTINSFIGEELKPRMDFSNIDVFTLRDGYAYCRELISRDMNSVSGLFKSLPAF